MAESTAESPVEPEVLALEDYVAKALDLDTDLLSATVDVDIAKARYESSDNLYKGIFSATPFSRTYRLVEPNALATNSFSEAGLRIGYTQFLPSGTKLTFSGDQYSENTRSSGLAKKTGYSIGLAQPILKNYFGTSDRLNAAYQSMAAQATEQKSHLVRNDACAKAVGHYIDAWVSTEKKKFNDEMLTLANELFNKSRRTKVTGNIGQLDWLGVQSEFLNQQNLSEQYKQDALAATLNLKAQISGLKEFRLLDPSKSFAKLSQSIDISNLPESNLQLDQLAIYIQAIGYKVKSEARNALPDLDLKIEATKGSGRIGAEKYRDDDLMLGLSFTWKLNDDAVAVESRVARLELQRAQYQYADLLRNRKINIEKRHRDILSKKQQISYEKERSVILARITEENKRRFLQGRIEFQDFLRVKEQLFVNQNSYLDKQAQMWKTLVGYALSENIKVPFCLGAKSKN